MCLCQVYTMGHLSLIISWLNLTLGSQWCLQMLIINILVCLCGVLQVLYYLSFTKQLLVYSKLILITQENKGKVSGVTSEYRLTKSNFQHVKNKHFGENCTYQVCGKIPANFFFLGQIRPTLIFMHEFVNLESQWQSCSQAKLNQVLDMTLNNFSLICNYKTADFRNCAIKTAVLCKG